MRIQESFNTIAAISKRELSGYFESPVAYVFLVIFLLLLGFFTFYVNRFFEIGQADLRSFFQWHPWVFMFLIPAVAMRLWAEERRLGTIELVLTLPVTIAEVTVGKFLAAWVFIGMFSVGRSIFKRGNYDVVSYPQPGHQFYSGGGHMPLFYFGRISAGHRSPDRMGTALARQYGFRLKFFNPFCLYCKGGT
jgi:hypothetical protein